MTRFHPEILKTNSGLGKPSLHLVCQSPTRFAIVDRTSASNCWLPQSELPVAATFRRGSVGERTGAPLTIRCVSIDAPGANGARSPPGLLETRTPDSWARHSVRAPKADRHNSGREHHVVVTLRSTVPGRPSVDLDDLYPVSGMSVPTTPQGTRRRPVAMTSAPAAAFARSS